MSLATIFSRLLYKGEEVLEKLQELHADLANESPQGVHTIVHNSGHAIQLDQPESVIDAIHQVVDRVCCSSTI